MRITSGIQLEGYPESCCIHCRRTPVRRGAIPSVEAPGRNRPMTRSQAPMRLMQQTPVAIDQRFLLQRNPDIGRIAAQCLAEKSRRRHADHW